MEDRRIYDIFKVQAEGKPVRVTSVLGLERAKLMLSYAPRASAIQSRGESPGPGNVHVAAFVLEFDGISRDPETFADWQAMARQTALDDLSRLRTGHSIPADVPPPPVL